MAISFVQATSGVETTGANSAQSSAFSSSVTTGNTVLVLVIGDITSTATTVSVSDTESNSYTCDLLNAYNSGSSDVISNPGSNNVPAGVTWVGIWRASNVTGGSSFKVTVTLGGSVNGILAFDVLEVAGLANASVVDTTAYNAGASGSPSSGTFTTGYATDFILTAVGGTGGSSSPTLTVPSGYTTTGVNAAASSPIAGDGAFEITSATQSSVNPTWTVTNFTDWVAVAYKAELIVQETAQATGSGVNSVTTSAFGSAVTTGNTIIVGVLGDITSTATTLTVTDTESNTYTCDLLNAYNSGSSNVISNPSSNNVPASVPFVGLFRASNVTGGSSFTVKVALGGSVDGALSLAAIEFNGLATSSPVDTSAYNASSTGSPGTGTFSTSNANDLLMIAFGGTGNPIHVPTITAPSGYTVSNLSRSSTSSSADGQMCYQIVGMTQSSVDPSWTTANLSDCPAVAVAYKQAAGSAPGQVTGLSVANDSTNPTTALDLSWNSDSGATSYTIQRAGTLGGTFSNLATGVTATTYTDSSLTAATEYAYQVAGVNGAGTGSYSTAVAWATEPAAPTSLAATVVSPTQINLSWTGPTLGSNIGLATPNNGYVARLESPPVRRAPLPAGEHDRPRRRRRSLRRKKPES